MSDGRTGGGRDGERPWYESLPVGRSWAALWSGYVRCACGAIWSMEAGCPVCGEAPPKEEWVVVRDADGTKYRVPWAFNGAEGRYEDWIYLSMLEREWLKPVDADLYDSIPDYSRPSARAIVVLLFWSYFETRIERLFRDTGNAVPEKVMAHLLGRYSSVGARMDRLYRVVFSTTYRADLNDLGYGKVELRFRNPDTGLHLRRFEARHRVRATDPGQRHPRRGRARLHHDPRDRGRRRPRAGR